jgi:23S rRNA (uracil1939-C5)-methyltransferase
MVKEENPAAWRGTIDSLSQDGTGVGTVTVTADGKEVHRAVFIPYAVPGDEVEAKITEQRGKYHFGEVVAVIRPSQHRVQPVCPHFGVCGGCDLEHVAYEEQLRQKARIAEFLIKRRGVALPHPVATLPSKERYRYRWRSRIAVRFDAGRVVAGFRRARSREIVPVTTCFIVAPEIMGLITLLNSASYGGPAQELEITAVVGEHRKLGLLVPLDGVQERKAVKAFFDSLYGEQRKLISILLFLEKGRLKTTGQVQERITYTAAGYTFSFLPENFIQANVATNETLIATALEFAGASLEGVALDLYAGIGNLSLPLAKSFGSVIAVEGNKRSCQLGSVNAARNKAANVLFVNHSVESYLREYNRRTKKGKGEEAYRVADVILLDPPRTGCSDAVIEGLLRTEAERLVYVSCDPVTLARDLAALRKRYRVADILCVDMFPDISHVETVVRLEQKE